MHSLSAPVENTDIATQITELRQEHSALKTRLEELNASLHLTPSEELEVRQIKRQKLTMKDHICALEAQV